VGLTRLIPYTIHVHAQSRKFDKAGNETTISYASCVAALTQAGYKGFVSIEYVGDDDPLEGIIATRDLIKRCSSREA
jgi:hypothetical protein